jgi:hypothetical protein
MHVAGSLELRVKFGKSRLSLLSLYNRAACPSPYARFGRNRRVVLCKVGTIAPDEARERCQKVLGNVEHGRHPLHGLGGTDGISLGMFIADNYRVWVNASRPRTAADSRRPAGCGALPCIRS